MPPAAPLPLQGRAAVVTGAASGIGRALALEAAARGMSLALADVDGAGLQALADELAARRVPVLARPLDVRSADAVEDFARAAFQTFASVALVFANAGVIRYNAMRELDLAAWSLVLDVNLRGVTHCLAAFVRRLVERAEPAQFVLTGSQASFIAVPEIGAYVASKHAVWGLAEVLRLELAGTAVGASLLAPPRVATPILRHTLDAARREGGEEAAEAIRRDAMTPEAVAALTLDRAAAREFLILPDEHFKPAFAARVAPLLGEA